MMGEQADNFFSILRGEHEEVQCSTGEIPKDTL